jgi:hypothetical protein
VVKNADSDEANLFGDLRGAAQRRFDEINFSSFNRKIDDAVLIFFGRVCEGM